MIFSGILLSRAIAFALDGLDVNEHRLVVVLGKVHDLIKLRKAVTVDRTEVYKSHILEHGTLFKKILLDGILDVLDALLDAVSDERNLFESLFHGNFCIIIFFGIPEGSQIARNRADAL